MPGSRMIATAVLLLVAGAAPAQFAERQLGLRLGDSTGMHAWPQQHRMIDLFGRARLPWAWGDQDGWRLDTFATASIGMIEAENDDRATLGNLGVALLLTRGGWPLALELGTAPGFISDTRVGERTFGGHFQFTSHLGLRLAPGGRWELGLRLQHASNADLYDDNEGQDFLALELGYAL